ncbi:MAG: MerR family transcriptional regulator [Candidatus Omnitrophica bacterium]|nr:MerR family transcriptional regulator [Candidatus Omnitrophota bacterium]
MRELINVEEVAGLFDISKATVNYYTNIGLIIVHQKKKNKRLYDKEDVSRRIEKIRNMMNMGYTLRLIQREFALADLEQAGKL